MHLFDKFWNKLTNLTSADDLWVAYSGGEDSRVLLELCHAAINKDKNNSIKKLQAIHIDHGLHPDSQNWAQHCQIVCDKLNILLKIIKVEIETKSGESLEDLARQARRKVWHKLLPDKAALLLAHHQQDQTETVLHRLFRGAGPTGLSGMAEISKFGKGVLVRPLLTFTKPEIRQIADKMAINNWIVDPSNANCKFERNFIRQQVLPLLQSKWPKSVANIARSAELCAEQNQIIDQDIKKTITEIIGSRTLTLSINKLLLLPINKFCQVIRYWLKQENLILPSRQQLLRIRQEILLAKHLVGPKLKIDNYELRRYRDDLWLVKDYIIKPKELNLKLEWDFIQDKILNLNNNFRLLAEQNVDHGIVLPKSARLITVYFGASHGKQAKKIFQELAIPTWERGNYPQIFLEDKLIAIVGLWQAPKLLATCGEIGISFSFINAC